MTYTVSPSEDQLFIGLQAWLMDALGLDINHVIQGLDNRVAPPKGSFVAMTPTTEARLSTNVSTFQDVPGAGTETIQQSKDLVVQTDYYGPNSRDWATVVSTLFQSDQAVQAFAPYLLAPLYAEDPTQLPLVDGEEQYEERWLIRLHFHYQPSLTAPMQFMTTAKIAVINVDTLS